jgi:DUF4097 and DUF4098 domain-containing protein YvlB
MKIIVIAGALLAATAANCAAQDRLTLPADGSGLVRIVAASGDVRIRGTSGAEVRVVDLDGGPARGLRLRQRDGGVDVDVFDGRDIEVRVPGGSRVDVRARNGDVEVEDVRGTVFVETMSGDVDVVGTPASVTVESISGDIRVAGPVQNLRLVTVSGDIELPRASGSVNVSSTSGDIEIVSEGVSSGEFNSTSGDVRFGGAIRGDALLHFSTASGRVELAVARNVSADFDIDNVTGRIRSDLGPDPRRNRYTGGENVRFTNGSGEARIVVSSVSGEVYIVVR